MRMVNGLGISQFLCYAKTFPVFFPIECTQKRDVLQAVKARLKFAISQSRR